MLFRKEYAFLSNMYKSPFTVHGINFKTVEHYYQSFKPVYYEDKLLIINAVTPTAAKALGKHCKIRDDWSIQMMLTVMRDAIRYKFEENYNLLQKLMLITEPIVEDNNWNDTFWGMHEGYGLNKLGKILEEYKISKELQRDLYKFKTNELARFKYNSGSGALLCDNCKVIIKVGWQFTDEERLANNGQLLLKKQLCKKCQEELDG